MIKFWTTETDKTVINKGLRKLLKKYKLEESVVKSTQLLVEDKKNLVVALGEDCKNKLAQKGIVPKNRTINSLRNKIYEHNGTKYLISYEPSVEQFNYSQYKDLHWDLQLVRRYEKTNTLVPVTGDYSEVMDFKAFYEETLVTFSSTGRKVKVSCDLETMGLDPYAPGKKIISVHVCKERGKAYGMYLIGKERKTKQKGKLNKVQKKYLNLILNSDHILTEGANFKYDLLWMRVHWKLKCTNFSLDTHLAGSLIDENVSNSLNNHAKMYTIMGGYDDAFNDKYDKDQMELVPREELMKYGCGDVDACYRSADYFRKYFNKHPELRNFYVKLLHPTGKAFHEIEALGCFIDVDHYSKLNLTLTSMIKKSRKKALKKIPKALLEKHTPKKDKEFNLSKASFLKDFLFAKDENDEPLGLGLKPKLWTDKAKDKSWKYASTAANHLAMLRTSKKAIPFLDCVEEFTLASKVLSTYVDGFMKHLRSDGRFHPSFFLYKGEYTGGDTVGTVTGRTSVKGPPVQTLTKRGVWAKPLRGAWIAPKGYVILGADYNEGELRVGADRSGDEEMLKAYANGISIHAKTAANINNIEIDEFNALKKTDFARYTLLRYGAKAGNFGLIFGMQVKGFCTYARDTFGVHYSLKEAEEIRNKHFELYSGLLPWHTREIKEAHFKGYVVNPMGRVRHLPMLQSDDWWIRSKEERRAINSPVQSCLNDLLFLTLVMFNKKYQKWIDKKDILPFLTVHDQVLFYVREKLAFDWACNITHLMSHLPLKKMFKWEPQVEFLADAEIGKTLASMESVKI